MPIITPAYPSMCATHNITQSTKEIILKEMTRAGDVVNSIFNGKLQWRDLFARHTFFTHGYKYYLSVVAASKRKEAQLIWSGLVESKIRTLVTALETSGSIRIAHPYVKGFDRVHRCHTEEDIEKVKNGDLQFQAEDIRTETTDESKDPVRDSVANGGPTDMKVTNGDGEVVVQNGQKEHIVYTTTYYIGIDLIPGRSFCQMQIRDANFMLRKDQKLGHLL
jgi:poly(A) polymerase